MANLPGENDKIHPCKICGRNFVENSLIIHEAACQKMAKAKRKIFDSGKQRATGSDITIDNVINARKEREMLGGIFPRPKTSWREKHEAFVNAVSTSKQANYPSHPNDIALSSLSKMIIPKDYVKCKYCGRSFNETAAERHIPFCKMQHEKKGPIKIQKISSRLSNAAIASSINDYRRLTNTSINRDSKMLSTKNDYHSAKSEHHLNISSRRSESLRRPYIDKNCDNDRRRRMSSSRTRNNSAKNLSNKSIEQMSSASERERLNPLSSYRASREKIPVSSQQSSFIKKK